jgi:hypothetical protein
MRKTVCILWIVVLMSVGITSAQESDYPDCEFQSTHEILMGMIQGVGDWQQLEQFNRDLAESLAFCRGLFFEGSGAQVLGPMRFPAGTFTLHLSGEGFTTVQGDLISGSCDAEFMFLGIQDGQPALEQPFSSLGCETTFSIQSESAWALRFEPVSVADADTPSGGTISYGAQVQGQLAAESVVEYFFTSEPGDVVTIGAVLTNGEADLQLLLFSQNGDLVASDDDGHPEGTLNPQLTTIPLPTVGDYRILVRHCASCSTNTSGDFILSLEKIN